MLDNASSKLIEQKLVINETTTNGLDSFFLTNDVQTNPITNTLESSVVDTEQLLLLLKLYIPSN